MKTRTLLLGAVASIAFAGNASAHGGWYIGLEGGVNSISDVEAAIAINAPPTVTETTGTVSTDTGWALIGTVGVAFNNWRIEGEVGYRDNTTTTDVFQVTEWSIMANVLRDFDISPTMTFSLGGGVGYDFATLDILGVLEADDANFAWQFIAGLNFEMSNDMDVALTYRYLGVQEPSFSISGGGASASVDFDTVDKHALTVGLRFRLAPSPD